MFVSLFQAWRFQTFSLFLLRYVDDHHSSILCTSSCSVSCQFSSLFASIRSRKSFFLCIRRLDDDYRIIVNDAVDRSILDFSFSGYLLRHDASRRDYAWHRVVLNRVCRLFPKSMWISSVDSVIAQLPLTFPLSCITSFVGNVVFLGDVCVTMEL